MLTFDPQLMRMREIAAAINATMAATLDDDGNILVDPNAPPSTPPESNKPSMVPVGFFTAEQVENFRKEEKNKLYAEIQKAKEETKQLKAEKEAREKAATDAQAKADAEARKAAEAEMSAKELLEAQRAEWQAQMDAMREEQAAQQAAYVKERRFQELQTYAAKAIAANATNIFPELQDISEVWGETEEEINARTEALVNKTAAIINSFQQAQTEQGRQSVGVSPFAPATGPEGVLPTQRTYSAEQVAAMNMKDYAAFRKQLGMDQLDSGNRGMYG